MVQVVSAEVFSLPDTITGHVTYKTTLTRKGIWALTVGIVDPGGDGPVGTTFLNFSRVDYPVDVGDAFLRVSFFSHEPVPAESIRKSAPVQEYHRELRKLASSILPQTFLNSRAISEDAGNAVLSRIRKEGIASLAAIAFIFSIIQIVISLSSAYFHGPNTALGSADPQISQEIENLRNRLSDLENRVQSEPAETPAAPPDEHP
jgi:hypothetical protein